MPLSCRFYKQKYPEVGDAVMVNVSSIAEMGVYVHLLEYNNIEGMILLSELSRRRIRSINKLIRVGKTEPVVVIRVDKEKGYIDLSKREVSPLDVEKCTERFVKAKVVNSILSHVAELLKYETDEQLEDLYQRTAWIYEEMQQKKASAYDFFKQVAQDPSILIEYRLDETTQEVLLTNIKHKLTSQAVKIRADIEVACYEYEGIDAVKAALKAGLALSTEELSIKINLIATPVYVMTTETLEVPEGLKALQDAIDVIEAEINKLGGVFRVEKPPKVVTASDEAELAELMDSGQAVLNTQKNTVRLVAREENRYKLTIAGLKIPETTNLDKLVIKFLANVAQIEFNHNDIVSCRCLSHPSAGQSLILIEFTSKTLRNEVFSKKRLMMAKKIYFGECFSKDVYEERRKLLKYRAIARAKGLSAQLNFDKLVIQNKTFGIDDLNLLSTLFLDEGYSRPRSSSSSKDDHSHSESPAPNDDNQQNSGIIDLQPAGSGTRLIGPPTWVPTRKQRTQKFNGIG